MPNSTTATPASERLHALDAVRGVRPAARHRPARDIVVRAGADPVLVHPGHPSQPHARRAVLCHPRLPDDDVLPDRRLLRPHELSSPRRRGFVRDRLQRIAVPLVVGWPIVFAPMALVVDLGGRLSEWRPVAGMPPLAAGAAEFPAGPSLVSLRAAGALCRHAAAARRGGLARRHRPRCARRRSALCAGHAHPLAPAILGDPDRHRVQPRPTMGRLGSACGRRTNRSSPTCRRGSASAPHSASAGCCIGRSVCCGSWSGAGC